MADFGRRGAGAPESSPTTMHLIAFARVLIGHLRVSRSKGSEHYNPRTNHLLLHPVPDTEIKSRSNQKKTFGGRR